MTSTFTFIDIVRALDGVEMPTEYGTTADYLDANVFVAKIDGKAVKRAKKRDAAAIPVKNLFRTSTFAGTLSTSFRTITGDVKSTTASSDEIVELLKTESKTKVNKVLVSQELVMSQLIFLQGYPDLVRSRQVMDNEYVYALPVKVDLGLKNANRVTLIIMRAPTIGDPIPQAPTIRMTATKVQDPKPTAVQLPGQLTLPAVTNISRQRADTPVAGVSREFVFGMINRVIDSFVDSSFGKPEISFSDNVNTWTSSYVSRIRLGMLTSAWGNDALTTFMDTLATNVTHVYSLTEYKNILKQLDLLIVADRILLDESQA